MIYQPNHGRIWKRIWRKNHDNGLNKMDSIENFHRNSLHACQKGNRFLTQIFEAVIPIKYDDDDDVIWFQWNRFIRLINVMIGSLELMDFRGFCTRFSIRWINQYWNIISRKKQRKTGNHKMKFNDFLARSWRSDVKRTYVPTIWPLV